MKLNVSVCVHGQSDVVVNKAADVMLRRAAESFLVQVLLLRYHKASVPSSSKCSCVPCVCGRARACACACVRMCGCLLTLAFTYCVLLIPHQVFTRASEDIILDALSAEQQKEALASSARCALPDTRSFIR